DALVAIDGQAVQNIAECNALLAESVGPIIRIEVRFGKNSTVPHRIVLPKLPTMEQGQICVANAIWGPKDLSFRPEFCAFATQLGTAIEAVDFSKAEQARAIINDWISRKTASNIPELLEPNAVKADTPLVVTNAIYLHLLWANPFDVRETAPARF